MPPERLISIERAAFKFKVTINAGVAFANADQRAEEGFETTFPVNDFAHYLLLRFLMPRLASGAVVVITTSDTHNPQPPTDVAASFR